MNDSLIVSTAEKMEAPLVRTDEEIVNKADEILVPIYMLKEFSARAN